MNEYIAKEIKPLVDIIASCYGSRLLAIAVIGAAARGEETWLNGKLVSDVDLALITKRFNPFFPAKLKAVIDSYLGSIPFRIDVGCIPLRNLRNHRSKEYYEARETAHILWGDKYIFRYVAIKRPEEIPQWEGVRLLFNRAFDLLQAFYGGDNPEYCIAKTYLAIGEAYLVFEGRYRCSYRERLEEIRPGCELEAVEHFTDKFERATHFKLGQSSEIALPPNEAKQDLLKALEHFLAIYTQSEGTLEQNIDVLSRKFYHPYHALIYSLTILKKREFRIGALFEEPCFSIWKEIISLLRAPGSPTSFEDVCERFWQMPQFLETDSSLERVLFKLSGIRRWLA
jgi:hypothetical protein